MRLIKVFLFTFGVVLAGNTDCLDKLIADVKNACDAVITSTSSNLPAKCKALKTALALLQNKVNQYSFCKNVYVHAFTDAYNTIDACNDTYDKYCKNDISTTTEYVTETTTTEAECTLECSTTTPEDTTTESSTTESSTTESSTTESSTTESSTTESSTTESSTAESSTTESSSTESSTVPITSTPPESSTTESSTTESSTTESSTTACYSNEVESDESESDESFEHKNKHKLKKYKSSHAIHFILEFFGGVKHNDKDSKENKANLNEEI